MQSSTAVIFRALVMLVCLIVLPSVALFGSSLPHWLDEFIEVRCGIRFASAREWLDDLVETETAESSSRGDCLSSWPGQLRAGTPDTPPEKMLPTGLELPLNLSSSTEPASVPSSSHDARPNTAFSRQQVVQGGTVAKPDDERAQDWPLRLREMDRNAKPIPATGRRDVSGQNVVGGTRIDSNWQHEPVQAALHRGEQGQPSRRVVPVSHVRQPGGTGRNYPQQQEPHQPHPSHDVSSLAATRAISSLPQAHTGTTQHPTRIAAPPEDAFTAIQLRLKQLGATYYLLETWGDDGQLYRFYCKMALHGNPDFSRYFEATDDEPLGAMRKVMAEVEAWSRGRL